MIAKRLSKLIMLLPFALFFPLILSANDSLHAIAMHGEPKYGPDFSHFSYVNPEAPKGGDVRLHALGSFDSLNPFISRGNAASHLELIYDSLLERSLDEPFTEYGLIADSISIAEDRSWVEFTIHPDARFHDGTAIGPNDVVFTFDILRSQGAPFYQAYYENIEKVEALDDKTVRFQFSESGNLELPLIVGQAPILPSHFWENHDFTRSSQLKPLGSGPYKIVNVDGNRSITYRRVEDYWARNLPVNRGRYNFDTITIDYYRDASVALESFKAGSYDFRLENNAKDWATSYNIPAVANGHIQRQSIPHRNPTGMQAFAFNTRLDKFSDPKVRLALNYLFDFEWLNRNMFYGAYSRTQSYFSNSELAARELPSQREREILEPFREKLPPEIFTEVFHNPVTDGSGNIRGQIRTAARLLQEAGWEIKRGKLTHNKTGEVLAFEFLLYDSMFERVVQPFRRNLERMGIETSIRVVDITQYINRQRNFDFNVVVGLFGQSTSPGNEQRNYWHSDFAQREGSRNIIGISNPVVDELVEKVISAPNREELVHRTRALDRVLLWNHYVIPHWHITNYRVAYWNIFGRPETPPEQGIGFDTWWVDSDKASQLSRGRGTTQQP
ncbi:extracellular solute-binding protein [Desulfurispira natronophila]|uniref:Microcin C transport system substrate-binding protein n=1 Tax=Desulfurispira natronophila TaxID=682562 RepID=A0A7W7Y2R9_9BACT|nr:extracellular solute-binding protein [Desulfurispira natronophila]MBB5020978.1 microcin C transport system substrate-binding protein [Desulfurispira natronophila]